MKHIWTISKRELNTFFDSLVAYIMLIAFLGFSGFFTWMYGADIFIRKQADLQVFFAVARWTLFFFIPAIAMRMIAEEKRSGTIELLLTKNVSDRQLIIGKYLACLGLVVIALLFTLIYYYSVSTLGDMDHGATLAGYLGLLLMSSVYISIGIFGSSLTSNQIVAFLLSLLIAVFFQFIFDVLAVNLDGWIAEVCADLSMNKRFESMARGVIDSKDLVFFITMTLLFLMLAELNISKRG
ncbi:MAG: ABC transporter permease [Saprospiraceae bacterium]|nr:ABC transporter permease [Saprospiraceae bacterium]